MRIISSLCFLLFISVNLLAQVTGDTIVVKTLNYNSGVRDTVINFPSNPNLTFEKIIMRYNMRCKNGLISPPQQGQTNIGCGEWDYSCNTFITDSTHADSTIGKINSHIISEFTGTTMDYETNPMYDYYRHIQKNVVLNSVISETQSAVGTGSASITHAIRSSAYNGKSQYLFTQSQLSTAGVITGNIDGILLNVLTPGSNTEYFRVKIKHTNKTALSASTPDTNGFTEVYFHNKNLVAGSNRIQFYTPFNWDGTSNLMIELSFTNPVNGNDVVLEGSATSIVSGIFSRGDHYFYFNANNYIEANSFKGIGGNTARSIEAWIKTNNPGEEICAWGAGTTSGKWAFRTDGNGVLRLEVEGGNVVGTQNVADGNWHHVACTFQGSNSTDIVLYVDGQLDPISSSAAITINTDIVNGIPVRLSRGVNNRYWQGYIDNVRIWNTQLSATTLQDWMYRKIDNTHPNYSNLKAHYLLNEGSGTTISDQTSNGNDATVINGEIWTNGTGEKLFKEFTNKNERPNLSFLQGSYVTTITNDTMNFAVQQIPRIVKSTQIISNAGTLINDGISYSTPVPYWDASAGQNYYDENGNLIQNVAVTPAGTLNISSLSYWLRSAMQYEIMSFVTPYGINLDLGMNGKTWSFDVTDFTPILKGPRRMLMTMGGQWQEQMDIQFLFIVGTPPRNVKEISQIWKANRSSTFASIKNEDVYPARNVLMNPDALAYKVRSSITGHGQEGEFIPRQHYFDVDGGNKEFAWDVWKVCDENPIYPQGGTWIYDRAGWCPGAATLLKENDITSFVSPGTLHSLDYGIDTAWGDSRYIASHQLVSYGAPNQSLDAAVVDILSPTNQVEYTRENPRCYGPKIKIQNTGSTALTSATIEYWVNNGTKKRSMNWSGNLAFLETEEVGLPVDYSFWADLNGPSNNVIYAEIKNPNGGTDGYSWNNKMSSPFEVTNVLPNEFVVYYKANLAPSETLLQIINDQGDTVYSKQATTANQIIRDTLNLPNGCYSFTAYDSDGDGIDFWANNDGVGFLRLSRPTGQTLVSIQPDFGRFVRHNFTINFPLAYEQFMYHLDVDVFPNPVQNSIYIKGQGIEKSTVKLYDLLGRELPVPSRQENNQVVLNSSNVADGIYIIKVQLGEKIASHKVQVKH